jgi:CrcB protein
MELRTAIAVFLGGGAGAAIRWLIGVGVGHWSTGLFPWATLIANILSVVILIGAAHILHDFPSVSLRPLIIVGICGGLSTFSTFSYETVQLLRDGEWPIAVTNVVLSVAVCLAALWCLLPEAD